MATNMDEEIVPEDSANCLACTELFLTSYLYQFSCGHQYCEACANHLLEQSLVDETLFPPSCCHQEIGVAMLNAVLTEHLRITKRESILLAPHVYHKYELRLEELATPHRTYCAKPRCGLWMRPSDIVQTTATCPLPHCRTKTCTVCKQAAHPGDKCRHELEDLAAEKNWKSCKGCHRMVELESGCNHMICRCGHQFCFQCGAAWVNKGDRGACYCPQFTLHPAYLAFEEFQEVQRRRIHDTMHVAESLGLPPDAVSDDVLEAVEDAEWEAEAAHRGVELRRAELITIVRNVLIARFQLAHHIVVDPEVPVGRGLEDFPGLL